MQIQVPLRLTHKSQPLSGAEHDPFLVLVSVKYLCLASGLSVHSSSQCHTVFYGEAVAPVLFQNTGAQEQACLTCILEE